MPRRVAEYGRWWLPMPLGLFLGAKDAAGEAWREFKLTYRIVTGNNRPEMRDGE